MYPLDHSMELITIRLERARAWRNNGGKMGIHHLCVGESSRFVDDQAQSGIEKSTRRAPPEICEADSTGAPRLLGCALLSSSIVSGRNTYTISSLWILFGVYASSADPSLPLFRPPVLLLRRLANCTHSPLLDFAFLFDTISNVSDIVFHGSIVFDFYSNVPGRKPFECISY